MNRLLISIITLLCLGNLSLAQDMKTSLQDTDVSQAKLRKAEQVVIRAMQRFGQTLDFKDVYREFYIKDKNVRSREAKKFANEIIEKNTLEKLDKAILEKLFIKSNNVFGLLIFNSYGENKDTNFDNFEQVMVLKLNGQRKLLYKRISSENGKVKSLAELIEFFSILDFAAKMLCNHSTYKHRKNLQNKITIDTSENSTDLPDNKPYLSKYKNFYKITVKINEDLLNLSFTAVEERDKLKIAFVEMIND